MAMQAMIILMVVGTLIGTWILSKAVPAMAGSNLFEHINHMVYTTGTAFVIALIMYGIIGMKYAGKELDLGEIQLINATLEGAFNTLYPVLLIPPVLVVLSCGLN